MSTPSPAPSLDFLAVLSESKRIINAHSRHFLALSVIFLLPLSFSFIVYPTLQQLLTNSVTKDPQIFLRVTFQDHPFISTKTLLLNLAYFIFVLIFSLCAVGTISCSVFHGFYGRPVKLISAIKSILNSFFPLLITIVVSQIIILLIIVIFGLLLFSVIRGIEFLGFQFQYSSPYFIGFFVVLLLALLIVLVYLQVNWTLVSVIVVVESNWGLKPLRRSTSLIKGMRGVAFSLLLFFGFLAGILMCGSSISVVGSDVIGDGWKSWAFVLQIVVTSTFLVLLMLYNAAANTVLYMYCKASNGELAMEIAEDFAREYASLPFDDGKVPHVVSVVHHI
ncbi:Transmembrane protein [Quillaja saponaria]|uniref:Transmembrane protein n=1 Tax=Quillaja saponaria TaxID=32244 RepID=A0AAD7PGB2_QUISA|nr:Transmembrane protein [Quillaja saponaria]KAJ7953865.1 Transmembrane protein [Quillaja saponaria]KAJ7953866.1 Transmembrane protein [Quillaja saponaria]